MTEETDLQSKVKTNGKESKAVGGVAIKKILLILAAVFRNLDLQPSAARDGSLLPRPLCRVLADASALDVTRLALAGLHQGAEAFARGPG